MGTLYKSAPDGAMNKGSEALNDMSEEHMFINEITSFSLVGVVGPLSKPMTRYEFENIWDSYKLLVRKVQKFSLFRYSKSL